MWEKGAGTFCAQHPPGRSGKRYLTPFPSCVACQDTAPPSTQQGKHSRSTKLADDNYTETYSSRNDHSERGRESKCWWRRVSCFLLGQRDPPQGSATVAARWLRSVRYYRRANTLVDTRDDQGPGQDCYQCYARNRQDHQDRKSHQTGKNRQRESARGTRPSGFLDTGSGREPCRNGSGREGTGRSDSAAYHNRRNGGT